MNKKRSIKIYIVGLFLTSFGILGSNLLGFGGFNLESFSNYILMEYVSRIELFFLFFVGLGFIILGFGNWIQGNKIKKHSRFILLFSYFIVGIIFLTLAVFGWTSELIISDFWANGTFKKIQNVLFFNNLSLVSFLAMGILQIILFFTFFDSEFLKQHKLLNVAKILTFVSGILWILKSITGYPLIKEAIFVLSYEFKFPLLNNVFSIITPLVYLFSQISVIVILIPLLESSKKSI